MSFPCGDQRAGSKFSSIPGGVSWRMSLPSSFTVKSPKTMLFGSEKFARRKTSRFPFGAERRVLAAVRDPPVGAAWISRSRNCDERGRCRGNYGECDQLAHDVAPFVADCHDTAARNASTTSFRIIPPHFQLVVA